MLCCLKDEAPKIMGHSKTTVDPILPNFDPLPPSSGQKWMFYILSTLCHMAPCGLSADPQPPPLVHVVIECPLIVFELNEKSGRKINEISAFNRFLQFKFILFQIDKLFVNFSSLLSTTTLRKLYLTSDFLVNLFLK